MSDQIENKTIDEYKEHKFHSTWHYPCSTCYNESIQIAEFKANEERMNGEQGEGRDIHLENMEKLEPKDHSSPWSPNPLE